VPNKKRASKKVGIRAARSRSVQGAEQIAEPREKHLREQLLWLLRGGDAHRTFDQVIAGIPPAMRGVRPAGQPFTLWQILEHLRLAQWDILEFSRNRQHVSPAWPQGYWPETDSPPSEDAWQASVRGFRADLKSMERLVLDASTDLHARIPWGSGQSILREVLLLADHNAYHLGQMVLLRRWLGIWPEA
jgi:uncharacterized damage-inducible protein DinB